MITAEMIKAHYPERDLCWGWGKGDVRCTKAARSEHGLCWRHTADFIRWIRSIQTYFVGDLPLPAWVEK